MPIYFTLSIYRVLLSGGVRANTQKPTPKADCYETRAVKRLERCSEYRSIAFLIWGGKFTSLSVGAGSGGLQGYMQLASAENVQHAFQIVGGYGQADFRLRSPQSTQQEAWMSEDAVFQIGEWMLRGGSSQPHRLRRGQFLHALWRLFVQVTG